MADRYVVPLRSPAQQSHTANCPGCELCLRDFREYHPPVDVSNDFDGRGRLLYPVTLALRNKQ